MNLPHRMAGSERIGRIFKSGNSLALRLPKEFGFGEGEEVTIVPHGDGSVTFWKKDEAPDRLMSLYGSLSTGFMAEGRGETGQDERDWTPGGR